MPYALRNAAADLMYTLYLLTLVALSAGAWWPGSNSGSRPMRHPLNQDAPDRPQLSPGHNAHHIFNAIHSSARQWGESLNHNGMSFFLATIPKGTLLYHGTHRPHPVTGMEWLAFEPEHALNFAWKPCDNETTEADIDAAIIKSHARSLSGWRHLLASSDSQHGELDDADIAGLEHLVLQDHAPEQPPPSRHGRPFGCIEPGFLHTYSAGRPLHLLYIDGQSAAKSNKGTLDSQDYVLRYNTSSGKPPPQRPMFGDLDRATDLCNLAQHDYDGRVDGFIRMEHGFEVVLCDFSTLDAASIVRAQTTQSFGDIDRDDPSMQEHLFMFMAAVGARYDGVGSNRVILNYDHFVTSFAYPETDLWAQGGDLPRLSSTSPETLARIKNDVKRMVIQGRFPGEPPRRNPPSHDLSPSPLPPPPSPPRAPSLAPSLASSPAPSPSDDREWRETPTLPDQSSEEERLTEMREKSQKEEERKPWWMQQIDRDYAKWRRSLSTSKRIAAATPEEARFAEMKDNSAEEARLAEMRDHSAEEARLAEMRDHSAEEARLAEMKDNSAEEARLAEMRDHPAEEARLAEMRDHSPEEARLGEMGDNSLKEEEKKPWWRLKIDRDCAKWRRPFLYRPYMDSKHHDRNDEILQCTTAYIPHHLLSIPVHEQSLAHQTTLAVAGDVCEVLWDIMDPNSENEATTYDDRITAIQSLMTRLAWTDWKKCNQPACALDENAASLMDPESSMGYWFDSQRQPRRPSGDGKKLSE
ncbi:hypothetical protein DV737_g395, partial [Chaetothyriales sp. CBS 132003]